MKATYRCLAILLLLVLVGCTGNPSSADATEILSDTPVFTPTLEPSPTSLPTVISPTPEPSPTSTPLPIVISYLDPETYQVTYTVAVRGGSFNFRQLKVYQPMPVAWDAQQDVIIDEVTPEPTSQNTDEIGNGFYYWDLRYTPAPGETAEFTIVFTFTAYETRTDFSALDPLPYDTSSDLYQRYTTPERYIESDDPAIVNLAAQIAGGETNPLVVARRIYDYVIDNTRYNLQGRGLAGAKGLLESGQGECGDYSSLFIALSRAAGIPARPVVGYWAISGTNQTHVWAEFYLEGIGWVPVDPTIGQSEPGNRDYYFGNMDNMRVILNKGFNISLTPAAPNGYVAPFLQVPLFWFWGSGSSSDVTMDRTIWSVVRQP